MVLLLLQFLMVQKAEDLLVDSEQEAVSFAHSCEIMLVGLFLAHLLQLSDAVAWLELALLQWDAFLQE